MAGEVGLNRVPVESVGLPGEAPLAVGVHAPLFSLPDADMETFELAHVMGRHIVVLCFYPRDGTPVCTRQAIDFSDHDVDFEEETAIVLGVSPDDVLTHAAFRDEHGLSIRLLSDMDGEVCRKYGVLQPRENGPGFVIRRATFVIDRSGVVRHAIHDVAQRGHAAEVLQLVRQIARNA